MLYDTIMIDSANLFYRLAKNSDTPKKIVKSLIKFVEEECKPHLHKDGDIYILFDPLSKSDLGESKSFTYSTNVRKSIDSNYKKGRSYSPLYGPTIEIFKKYYSYRGDSIKLVYSNQYEADDFVEPIVKSLAGKKIAIITTDNDYARYISDDIDMINKGFEKPYTIKEFYDDFKFYPTPAANTLYKAIFGDSSDNIEGCINLKKARFITNIRKTSYNYIKYVSDNKISLDDALSQFKTANFNEIVSKKDRGDFGSLFVELYVASQRDEVLLTFYKNIKLIRSQLEGKDVSKFIHSSPEKIEFNEIQKQAIFGIDAKSWFGKV